MNISFIYPSRPSSAITDSAPSSVKTAPSTAINGLDGGAAFKHNSLKNTRKFVKKIRDLPLHTRKIYIPLFK
jgi:hypothetical protein